MRSSCKSLFFYFLLLANVISASGKSNININTTLEYSYSKTILDPGITVNSNNLNQFTACLGSASALQTFTVSGSTLNNNITISAPAGYEISLNGTTWSSSLSLSIDGSGDVSTTTISIRIAANASSGTHDGTVSLNSGTGNGASNESIQVNGYVLNSNSIVPGTISGNQTVCGGGNPDPFVSDTNGNDGLPSSISSTNSYIWQSSTNNSTWTTISGANNATYNPPSGISVTTYYRRILQVTVGNNFPCQSVPSNTITVTVINSFAVNAGNDIFICKGQTINLSATSSGTNQTVTYHWSGPSGFVRNSQSPTISNATISMTGNYTVTASIGSGCQVTDVVHVEVFDEPAITSPQFQNGIIVKCTSSPSQTTGAINFLLTIPSYTSNILNYTINWGNGSPVGQPTTQVIPQSDLTNSVVHIYNVGLNTFSITINFTNGCSTTRNYSAFIGSSPAAATLVLNQNQANGCAPLTTQWTFTIPNNVTGTYYTGSWGEASTQDNFVFNQGGLVPTSTSTMSWSNPSIDPATLTTTYIITKTYLTSSCGTNVILGSNTYYNTYQPIVITQNPCTTTPQPSGTGLVSVGKKPTASFDPTPFPTRICTGVALQLISTSSFGQTIPTANGATCLTTGNFYWTVTALTTVTSGAWSATGLGSNNGLTVADFDSWTNGLPNPSITFNQTGTYRICLYVANSCGVDSVCKDICVQSKVTPAFTLSTYSGCKPLVVSVTNTSDYSVSCDPVQYLWAVAYTPSYCGASISYTYLNSTSTDFAPTFQFNNPGTYGITLKTTNPCGSLTSQTQNVIVKQPPTVSITTIPDYCLSASISPTALIDSCSDNTINNPTYLWSFPGGTPSTSTALNPTNILYSTPGTYTVSLSVTNECGTTQAVDKSFKIYSSSVVGTASADQTICQGNTPAALTLTGYTGTIQWQSSTTGTSGWSNIIGATSSTLILGSLTSTRYYQAVVTNGICPAVNSNMVTITVNPASVGGTASLSQTICFGNTPNALTLTGNVGSIQWQSSTSSTGPWTNISGETSSTLVLGALTSTMYYQAVVTSGICPPAISSNVIITVFVPSIAGNSSADQTICQGSAINPLVLTGNTGTIQWQYSTTGTSGWTNINSATGATLTSAQMGNLTATRFYRAVVTNGVCPSVISNIVTISVNPASVGGTASLSQTICSGNTPNALTLAGNVGTIQWQSSTSSTTGPWTNISGETSSTLVLGALTSTMYYQAVSTSGNCPSISSSKVTINVSPTSVAGTASADQTICQGNQPAALTLTGYTGSIQWQYSTTGISGWTTINTATGATLTSAQMGALTSTRYYQAVITSGVCTSVISNMVTITVNPTSVSGTVISNQTLCSGSTPSALTLSGNVGTIQWQSSTNNSTFNNIVGEISSTLTLGALTSTMYYQAVVTSGVCPSATPSKVTITVNQPSVAGTASANQTICQGTPPAVLTLAGNTGTIQWQSAASASGPWTNISGAVSATLTVAQMAVSSSTKYFQAVVTNGTCPFVISNVVTISVSPTSVQGTASSNQSICSGFTPNALTLSGNVGTIQWQSSTNNSTFNNIAGETNSTLTLGALTSTMYYQAVVTSGVCPSALSAKVIITVNPLPIISGTLSVCIGSTTQLTGSATPTATNPWISSDTNVATVNNSGLVTAVNLGSATITYTNSNGCQITAQVIVNSLPTISGTLFVCKGSTTQLTGSGTPATTGAWVSSVPAIATINSTTGLVTAVTAGTTIITYTNSNGCKITATITVNPLGQVNTTTNQSLCDGGIVNVNFSTNTVTGTTTYIWTSTPIPNVGLQATGSGNISFTASNTGSGIATSTVEVTPTYTNGGVGCAGPKSQFVISVYPPPTISVHPTPTQDICVGGTVPAFNVSYNNGYGSPDYQWFYNTSPTITGAITISGAINPSYTPPSFLATGTYYYFARVCLNGLGCGCVYSNIAEVHVYGDPNATITPSTQTICQNTSPTPIVVSASAGIPSGVYTYQWYINVAPNTIGGIPLVPAVTTSTFTPPTNTVQTNYYYCIISNGLNCDYTTSVVRVVTVAAPIAYLQPTPTQTVCINGTPTSLVVDFINGTGTPTYQWYSNTVNALSGTAITGATSLSYTPPTSATGTLYYYCIATYNSGGCTTATSNIAQVIVNPIQTITTQPLASQDICVGGTIAPLSVAYTDGVGTATYQWYSNTTNSNTLGTSISGANASSYTPPVFNTAGDYYYYATVSLSGSGCGSIASATALVRVVADPTVTITPSTQTICENTTPTNLVVTPSGGVGTFSYQWFSNNSNNTSTGTSISGANTASYTPSTITLGTKYYYCVITQSGLGCGVTSAAVSVQVVAAPAVNTQPTAFQTVCLNGAPTPLAITLINGTGTPTYQWYSNTVNALSGTAITGATSLSYTPPTSATGTLYYYCIATYNSGGCTTATSNIAQVIVNPIQTITTQPLVSQDICVGGTIAPLAVAYTDGVGTATYQWYSNTTNSNTLGTSISGANASSYTPPVFNTAGDYYYYATVSLSGSGCGSVASATALVRVVADPTVTITPSTQTICENTTPTNLVVTPSGGVGTFSYQWFSNTSNNTSTGTSINGANAASYTPPNSVVGIKYYYCIISQTGLGCSVTSSSVQVIIVSVPTISNQPVASQTICQNDPSNTLSVNVINGTGVPVYQWYSNTVNALVGATLIAGATNSTYVPSTILPGTKYYYCIIQYSAGSCGSLTTTISTVIVNSIATIPNKFATICSGTSFNISPSGAVLPEIVPSGTLYTWFVNPTPNSQVSGFSDMLLVPQPNISQTLTNNGAIPYNVVYQVTPITGGCQGLPFTITVTVNPKVKPNVTINNVICNSNPPFCNGSILLAPTGGSPFNYLWNIPGTTSNQSNLCSGNYWVDIADTYSCTYRFNYTVTVPPPMISVPTVNPINNTNCDVAINCNGIIQVAVTGGTPFASTTNPYQYQWFQVSSSGINIPIATSLAQGNISILQNLCGGTYYLVVTDSVGCQKQFGPYTITDPAPLFITSTLSNFNGYQVSCNGGNNGTIGINVTGGNGPINVILNPLGPNSITLPNPANFTGLPAGNYTVVIRDLVSNCPDIVRNIVLTAPPALQANVTPIAAILCNGNFASYQAVVSGGIPFSTGSQYHYLWTPSNEITSSATNLPAGAYNLLITDANGCTINKSGVISQPSLLVATANSTTPIRCFGGTATVTVTATGGVPNTTSGSPTYSGTGVFTVSSGVNVFTVTDFNGCQKTISINVPEPPLLQVTAVVTTPISCFGGNATVTVSAAGGSLNYTGTGTFTVPAGNNIPFTVIDANGCSKTVLLTITQPPLLVATATVTSPIVCNGGTGVLTISGVGGTPFTTGPLYLGTGPITVSGGTGTYTISDANGCSTSVLYTIAQPTPVIATATIISPILCKGGTAIISVTASGGVLGTTGYTGTGNFTVYAGQHCYTVRDGNNCISSTVCITVTEPPLLVASSSIIAPVLCNGGNATINVSATGGTPSYQSNGFGGDFGNYTVGIGLHVYTVIDANGCRSSTSITVTQPGPLAFTIKSATNPNCFPNRLYNNGAICISITGGTNPFPVGPGWVRSTNLLTPNDWCLNGLIAGTYTIAITDVNNCPSSSRTITLTRPTPLTAFVTSNVNVNCPIKNVSQTNIVFAAGGVPGYIYNWSGGIPCPGPPNPQCMTTDSNGSYTANVNDQEGVALGCIPIQVPVLVNLPVIGNPLMSISSSAMSICGIYSIKDPITFTNISTGDFTSLEWFVDGVSLAGANSVSHIFTTIGDHTITLVVNYTIGGVTCTYSISQKIAVTRGYDMIVPNAFTPANHDGINDNFKPEYNCMKELEMRVYDTWGSLLYVESGPTLKGWDGTINGHESENGNYLIVVRATTLFGAIIDYNGPFTLLK